MPLENVKRGKLIPDERFVLDPENLPSYRWLENEIGYYPLFLGVGDSEASYITGYAAQWRAITGSERDEQNQLRNTYQKAGEFSNLVQFAFALSSVPRRDFTDYDCWHIVLMALPDRQVSSSCRHNLFRKNWDEAAWLRYARRDGTNVQMVAPELDLDQAEFIWVRNKKNKTALELLGFKNVQVKRLPVERRRHFKR